jgi:hypothetical protein
MVQDIDTHQFPQDHGTGIPQEYHMAIDYRGKYASKPCPVRLEADGWVEEIADIIKEQFGVKPKEQTGYLCLI